MTEDIDLNDDEGLSPIGTFIVQCLTCVIAFSPGAIIFKIAVFDKYFPTFKAYIGSFF